MKLSTLLEPYIGRKLLCSNWSFKKYFWCLGAQDELLIIGSDEESLQGQRIECSKRNAQDEMTKMNQHVLFRYSSLTEFFMNWHLDESINYTPPIGGGKSEMLLYHDCGLLLSLFKLCEKIFGKELSEVNAGRIHSMDDRFCIPEKAEYVINWCQEHGMPFLVVYDSIGGEVLREYSRIGFVYKKFLRELHLLYMTFFLWWRVYRGSSPGENSYQSASKEKCKELLTAVYLQQRIALIPWLFEDQPMQLPICKDLFGLAYAQMLSQMTAEDNKVVDTCTRCGKLYVKSHQRTIYCPDCHRTRYQVTRQKQREAKQSAKKEGQ